MGKGPQGRGSIIFDHEGAPCTDVQQFYGRFRDGVAAGKLHCKFRYHFSFKRNPIDVTVTLFYSDRNKTVWVFVQPIALISSRG